MKITGQAGETGYASLTAMEWSAEKRAMETLDTSLAGRRILVMDVAPEEAGQLGYTSKGSIIHVAREHEYYKRFTRDEASVFRFGVNVHEALHQVFTDFDSFHAMADGIPIPFEQEMFSQIFNLVEDPAIENFADQVVGGFALDTLYFAIEKIYKTAMPVSGPQNHGRALEEYLDALIQFGDRGIIKGGFSSDVAREYFNRTAPLIYQAVNEPNGSERVRLAMEVYKIAKTLWAGRPASNTKQAVEAVTRRYAKSKTSGFGSGKTPQKAEDTRNECREKEIRKQQKKEEEALRKDAKLDPGGKQTNTGEDTGKDPKEPDGAGDGGKDPKDTDPALADTQNDDGYTVHADHAVPVDHADAGEPGDDESTDDGPVFQYDPKITEKFAGAMKKYLEQGEAGPGADVGTERPESYKKMIQAQNKQFSGVKEKNIIPSAGNMEDCYTDILNAAAWIVGPLTTQLKKIFIDDRGGKAYAQRGKLSMKRAASGRTTIRMLKRGSFRGTRRICA